MLSAMEVPRKPVILKKWDNPQRQKKRRFVMMLEWVEEGVAERRGLVSTYRV